MERKQTRQGYADGLIELASENDRVLVLDSDVAKATKTCDFEKAYPERFFNCGVQEANMMAVAAGLAIEGYIPYASTFGVFASCRAADQVRNSIAYPKLNVKIGASHCGITVGADGASHQANEDIAIMRAFPNMTVLVPGDYEEAKSATKAAASFDGPVYIRLGRDKYPVVEELHGVFEIGKSTLIRRGDDVTIITTGIMISEGMKAAQTLQERGYSARLIHMPTVKPLDGAVLLEAAHETKGIVTAEEHSIIGGLGEAVAGFLAGHHPTIVRRIGIRDVFGESGTADELMDIYGLRAANIVEEAVKIMEET